MLSSIEGLELVGIADKAANRARNLAKRFRIKNTYADYLDLLDEGLDFAVLCTPSHLHGQMIVDCCDRGIHVLTEKPLAHDTETALAAAKAAKLQRVKLCVVQNYRYCPALRKAKKIVDSGRLGKVLAMIIVAHTPHPMTWTHSRWLYTAGGVVDDFGPHVYDIMTWFGASSPQVVFALGDDVTQRMDLANYAHVSVGFGNSMHAAADLSWFSGSRVFAINIYGTGGRLQIDVTSDSLEEVHGLATPVTEVMSSWHQALHTIREAALGRLLIGGIAYYDQLYDDFVRYLENIAPAPVPLLDSLRAVQIMDYSRRSIVQGRALRPLTLPEELI